VVLQVQYSLLSSGSAQSSTKAVADDLGVVLIAYSPLALGLLTGGCQQRVVDTLQLLSGCVAGKGGG
jgi:aryl-alcohol dehydrogenase-like predicted oxidoreductase